MLKLRVTPKARNDLDDIYDYTIASFGEELAEDYAAGFRDVFQRLAENPNIGPRFDHPEPDMRSIGYRSHRIYYIVTDDTLVIVRIFHKARDVPNLLN